jgi:flagellar basal body rod protein FlgB
MYIAKMLYQENSLVFSMQTKPNPDPNEVDLDEESSDTIDADITY